MEPLSSTSHTSPTPATPSLEEVGALVQTTQNVATTNQEEVHHTKNLYPIVRHTLLIICVLFSLALILLLVHQNGKSIYDNGI